MRAPAAFALMLAMACAKDAEEGRQSISGQISIPSHGLSADIHWDTAIAYAEGGRIVVFLTGALGASCERIAEYLGPNTGRVSKSGILTGGSCTLMLAFDDWDGRVQAQWSPTHTEGYNPGLDSVLRCDLGEGEWVLETRVEEYEDHYWSGDVWSGIPTNFGVEISGDEGDMSIELDLRSFDGNFPYAADLERYPLDADINGQMKATWCPALSTATVL